MISNPYPYDDTMPGELYGELDMDWLEDYAAQPLKPSPAHTEIMRRATEAFKRLHDSANAASAHNTDASEPLQP